MKSHNPIHFRRQLRQATVHLRASDARLGEWIESCGSCALQVSWERSVYEALVRAIAHQQLHGRAAQTILERLITEFARTGQARTGLAFPTARQLKLAPLERLRKCGFSLAKATAIQGIAAAAVSGEIPERSETVSLSNEELIERLVGLRGVGRWTVEMLLIFTLGRLDVMPVDDFGIRAGVQHLLGLSIQPRPREVAAVTDHLAPYRSVAAWYLWRLADARKGNRV